MSFLNMLFIVIAVVIVGIAIVCLFRKNSVKVVEHKALTPMPVQVTKNVSFAEKADKKEMSELARKLEKLKYDIGQLLMRSVSQDRGKIMHLYHAVMHKYDERKIAHFVESLPPHLKKDMTLDGATIKDPVIRMHGKNFNLFDQLYKIGLVPMLGNVVAMSYWAQQSTNKTYEGFTSFVKCMQKIDWSSKDVWSSMDATTGHIAQCVR